VSSVSGTVDALSGTTSSLGLVTQFYITPIPEPQVVALLFLGGLLLLTMRRKLLR
jgi:hypothetical protein